MRQKPKYPFVVPVNDDAHNYLYGCEGCKLNVVVWVSWRPNQCYLGVKRVKRSAFVHGVIGTQSLAPINADLSSLPENESEKAHEEVWACECGERTDCCDVCMEKAVECRECKRLPRSTLVFSSHHRATAMCGTAVICKTSLSGVSIDPELELN